MLKSIALVLVTAYALWATIKIIELNYENTKLKNYIEEIKRVPQPQSPYKIYEVKVRDTVYLTKFKIKEVFKLDTIFQIMSEIPKDTFWATYNWTWLDFLKIKDTIHFYNADGFFKADLYRYWSIKQPVFWAIKIYEKKPEDLWWQAWVSPPEFVKYANIELYSELKKYKIYAGGGLTEFNKKVYPTLGLAFIYKRNLFNFDIGINSLSLNYKLRLY